MPFFDLGGLELFLIAVVALMVVGPKDLPKLMRQVGRIAAKVRGTARHFKSGLDEMMRQAELEEMRDKWDRHNQEIMRANPDAGVQPPPDRGAPAETRGKDGGGVPAAGPPPEAPRK